ncbi:MAG: DUF86 domain-containing protein [Desulfobacula sp.]|nr:DUF86 domain-containing protein [Desulfobacula sp.]
MVDKDIILAKSSAVRKHIKRIKDLPLKDFQTFQNNPDYQDILLFNIQLAVQNCFDIAAHIISDEDLGIPGSTNEMFYTLEENGYLTRDITEKMVRAVGFRNLIVHEYVNLKLDRVYEISKKDINDLEVFLRHIFSKL